MVIDDSAEMRELICESLRHRGYESSGFENGFDALKEFEQALGEMRPFNAALIDYAMPSIDGLTCAMRIRQIERDRGMGQNKGVKIFFFTGHKDLGLSEHVQQELGAYEVCDKTSVIELLETVERTIPKTCGAKA